MLHVDYHHLASHDPGPVKLPDSKNYRSIPVGRCSTLTGSSLACTSYRSDLRASHRLSSDYQAGSSRTSGEVTPAFAAIDSFVPLIRRFPVFRSVTDF